MNTHRQLTTWQHSQRLVHTVYRLLKQLPREERFAAADQLRRAAWSVHNNIAEGNARRGKDQLRQFVNVALGSLAEVDAMVATLSQLYPIDPLLIAEVESLRQALTGQLFALMRASPR
jgi:four helix bundle protein